MGRPKGAKQNLSRMPFIEGMRGLAALYVVFGHFCSMSDPRAFQHFTSNAPANVQSWMAPFWYGHLAVAVFIVISGFCLQMSLFPGRDGLVHGFVKFFGRRARRVLPPYYACLILSTIVAVTVTAKYKGQMPFDQYLPVTGANFLAHAALIHNWNPDWMYKINGVLWSIAVEAQLYLIFPFLALLIGLLGRWVALAASVVASAYLLLTWPQAEKIHVWYGALFVLGMAAAHAAYRPMKKRGVRPKASSLLWIAAAIGCLAAISLGWRMPVIDAFGGVAAASLMYCGAVNPRYWPAKVFAFRPLVWLGVMSYSLYLMHHPIQQLVFALKPAEVVTEGDTFIFLLKFGLPTILACCAVFHLIFERPFMRRLITSSRMNPEPEVLTHAVVEVSPSRKVAGSSK